MAASTGLLVAVGGIAGANELLHDHADAALRIAVATVATAVIFAGIEAIPGGKTFAVGLAAIALVGVVFGSVTPGVPPPAVQILEFMGYGETAGK